MLPGIIAGLLVWSLLAVIFVLVFLHWLVLTDFPGKRAELGGGGIRVGQLDWYEELKKFVQGSGMDAIRGITGNWGPGAFSSSNCRLAFSILGHTTSLNPVTQNSSGL